MTWTYSQSTGEISWNGRKIDTGYSGSGECKNKPSKQGIRNCGPIPRGEWLIHAPETSKRTGPYVLPLTPVEHDALGRTDFQIHGDSVSNPGTASTGCIILKRTTREYIWHSNDTQLMVVA